MQHQDLWPVRCSRTRLLPEPLLEPLFGCSCWLVDDLAVFAWLTLDACKIVAYSSVII